MIVYPAGKHQAVVDRTVLAKLLDLSVMSIRRHCEPAACDRATKRPLYLVNVEDLRAASPTLRNVVARPERQGMPLPRRPRVA